MYVQPWVSALQESFNSMLVGVVTFIPNLLFAIIIFVIGWFIGAFLGHLVAEAIKALRVDHALKAAGFDRVVTRAGYSLNSGNFLGALVKWFVIIVFLLAALQVLGLTAVTAFLQFQLLPYLPQVIIAVLIILVGAVVAEVAQGLVAGSARAAGITSAGFAGTIARWAIWFFAIIIALSQLGIGTQYFQTLFLGIVVALSLAFGLAFGLGGQEAAARMIERTRSEISNR
jgi:small-conductance mechanosensitive channel